MSAQSRKTAATAGPKPAWWAALLAVTGLSAREPKGALRPGSPSKDDTRKKPQKSADVYRETVESIVVAFVLAFLFRTFLAEAFVIPTGSMAPTLMGRHKDFACTQCGHHYTVGASDEVDKETNLLKNRLQSSICPNCNYMNDVYANPVFNGDRILVNKFPYEFGEPDRFDVFVFRYPEDPQTNYIKRLVGMPGESLKIERGDLYARQGSNGEYRILRKTDPWKQKVLQQSVYDDTEPPRLLLKHGWPERWAALQPRSAGDSGPEWIPREQSWSIDAAQRVYQVTAKSDWNWLRYRHLVPTEQDWNRVEEGQTPNADPPLQLIADFCGYNAYRSKFANPERSDWFPEAFWVGDLTLNARIEIRQTTGSEPAVMLELVEGVRRYRCEFDLQAGTVSLSRTDDLKGDGSFSSLASSPHGIRGTGQHDVSFANVDDRLCLWIDRRLVSFGADAEFVPPPLRDPQVSDLHPVGLAVKDVDAKVSQLKIERDVYYRALKWPNDSSAEGDIGRQLARALGDVIEYNRLYQLQTRTVEFDPLDHDEYFAMGDNSARSYDGRLWRHTPQSNHAHAVNRSALIGKAFFIYWPHGIPFLNHGKGFPVAPHGLGNMPKTENYPVYTAPFYPQWWRWKRIR